MSSIGTTIVLKINCCDLFLEPQFVFNNIVLTCVDMYLKILFQLLYYYILYAAHVAYNICQGSTKNM